MAHSTESPAQLRNMFGENLRQLSAPYASISDLSRQLGINRTQFNRYLSGESFPRPDVLARICNFFNVDARVLLEPVDKIETGDDPIANPFLRDFFGTAVSNVTEDAFPSGFYRFSRRSFTDPSVYIVGLIMILREGANTFMRGYESVDSMNLQNLPTNTRAREFRALVMQQEDGIVLLVSRRNAMTSSFNYLYRVASFENNFWVGFITRTVPEEVGRPRALRMVYEFIGNKVSDALPVARQSGFHAVEDLLPFHRRLLQPDAPFF